MVVIAREEVGKRSTVILATVFGREADVKSFVDERELTADG